MGPERKEVVDHFRAQACLSGQMVSHEAGSVCVSWVQTVPEILRIISVCLVSVLSGGVWSAVGKVSSGQTVNSVCVCCLSVLQIALSNVEYKYVFITQIYRSPLSVAAGSPFKCTAPHSPLSYELISTTVTFISVTS